MRKEIKEVLNTLNIKSYAVKRPERSDLPCIVYTVNDLAGVFADGVEESSQYDIYLNLFIKDNVFETVEKVKKAFNKNGFVNVSINDPLMFDGEEHFQVVFNYTKYKANSF